MRVTARYCGTRREWWLNYSVYYVHDGNLLAGHRHDWEGITIIFKQAREGEDVWVRHTAVYNRHDKHDIFEWNELETVWGEGDVTTSGNDRYHPKVYVGFFSHAAYRHKCDATQACSTTNGGAGSKLEYRSSDWYRLP
ncbi:hypothetical protein EJ08DRAFT_683897 [Tothia fuscella]|uniref:Uncharacterized protein n=1 Tax=Tothia fuscella TaxID=1048955 RepID=A0A9P4NF94_9PEZI|nr:hypothetical protein EJ08DRAFT_683897 [Tothia fuscella]